MGKTIARYLIKGMLCVVLPVLVIVDLITMLILWLSGVDHSLGFKVTEMWIDIIGGI